MSRQRTRFGLGSVVWREFEAKPTVYIACGTPAYARAVTRGCANSEPLALVEWVARTVRVRRRARAACVSYPGPYLAHRCKCGIADRMSWDAGWAGAAGVHDSCAAPAQHGIRGRARKEDRSEKARGRGGEGERACMSRNRPRHAEQRLSHRVGTKTSHRSAGDLLAGGLHHVGVPAPPQTMRQRQSRW